MLLRSVVLPAPKNPVNIVTGILPVLFMITLFYKNRRKDNK